MPPGRMRDVRKISEQLLVPHQLVLIHEYLLRAVERRQGLQVPQRTQISRDASPTLLPAASTGRPMIKGAEAGALHPAL